MHECAKKIPFTSETATTAAASSECVAVEGDGRGGRKPIERKNSHGNDPRTSSPWDHSDRKRVRCILQEDHSKRKKKVMETVAR